MDPDRVARAAEAISDGRAHVEPRATARSGWPASRGTPPIAAPKCVSTSLLYCWRIRPQLTEVDDEWRTQV